MEGAKKLDLSAAEREHFTEMRALSFDDNGCEILVGLSLEETNRLLEFSRGFASRQHKSREQKKQYLELHNKHEIARLAVVGAEHLVRTEKPTRH